MVITTAKLLSAKPELRFCAGSNPARAVSVICDGENPRLWSRLEIRLKAFVRSAIPQKQFIIIIIISIIIMKEIYSRKRDYLGEYFPILRSSLSQMFNELAFSKTLCKFQKKATVLQSFFNKSADFQACNFIKKRFQH